MTFPQLMLRAYEQGLSPEQAHKLTHSVSLDAVRSAYQRIARQKGERRKGENVLRLNKPLDACNAQNALLEGLL